MDYSLLVGIHDLDRAEQELNDTMEDENGVEEEDEDSTGSGGGGGYPNVPTPPDSPQCLNMPPPFLGVIDPKLELFAVKSDGGMKWIILDFLWCVCMCGGIRNRLYIRMLSFCLSLH